MSFLYKYIDTIAYLLLLSAHRHLMPDWEYFEVFLAFQNSTNELNLRMYRKMYEKHWLVEKNDEGVAM